VLGRNRVTVQRWLQKYRRGCYALFAKLEA